MYVIWIATIKNKTHAAIIFCWHNGSMDFIYKMKNGINGCFFYINCKSYLSLSIYEIFTFHNIVIILYGFAEIRGAALTARSPD